MHSNIQTPLIDRELFFGDPEISGAKCSPNGEWLSFIKPFKGTRNIWIKKLNEPFDSARPITDDRHRPIGAYFWTRDNRYILYIQDKAGNENFMIYAVDPYDSTPADTVPEARNLTDKENVRVQIYKVSKSDPDVLFIGINDRDPSWHDLYSLRISSGELTLLRENHERMVAWIFDLKDELRLAMRSNEDGSTDLLRLDQEGSEVIYHCSVLEGFHPVMFHPNLDAVYMVSDVGKEVDLSRLILLDIYSKSIEWIESDPENKVDFGSVSFSDLDYRMIATIYEDDKTRIYWKDKDFEDDFVLVQNQFPNHQISFNHSTTDEQLWLFSISSDQDPGAVYSFDRRSKEIVFQYRPRPNLPLESLSSMEPVRYPSSDGLIIQGYLSLPKGVEPSSLPLIVLPHGGPWARDSWGYHSYAQFLANRGYAVLQANFRSSVGFGKKFMDAGNLQWGELMQDDLTWGVYYLVSRGIADARRVGIMGGSYGGYAALAGLCFTPDVYACGVSIVGPSSLLTLLDSIPPYWEAGRTMFHTRMGDPRTEEGEKKMKKQSPLYSIHQIKAPLLVVQGANDPRVKKHESDQIVRAMQEKQLDVEYLCADDEGHGFARPVNNMAFLMACEKFLAKHLGGRAQEDGPDAVVQRLAELRVQSL
ncbi:MAG TPA: S9 family peptidase [Saprospiraceae bacterium]|nr:S9 family peptidase [Saprospiraceae bacterium]